MTQHVGDDESRYDPQRRGDWPGEGVRTRAESTSKVLIRPEREDDRSGIRAVNTAAFETSLEADLVDALRREASPIVSMVAEDDGVIVGHIIFSPVNVHPDDGSRLMGLGPMAVSPARQRSGIGSELVEEGLEQCRTMDYDGVVVLGHPDYYPRFGFAPAADFGLRCEYDVPEELFRVLELTPGSLKGRSGTVRYSPSFPPA